MLSPVLVRARSLALALTTPVLGLALATACAAAPDERDDGDTDAGEGDAGEGDAGEGDAGEGDAGEGDAGEGDAGEGEGDASEGDAGEGEAATYGAYAVDGQDTVDVVTLDAGDFDLLAFVPSSGGAHPVVSLSPGLQQPAVAYTSFGLRLASHGIVVVVRDDPGAFVQTPDVVQGIAYIVNEWLPAQNGDATSPLFEKLDVTRVGLAGHSRGGKASLLAAEHQLNAVADAWFGLDPVDSGTLGDGQFANQSLTGIGMPTAFLFAEVESNCSPASTTEAALWPVASAPAVKIVGLGAGHTQLEDVDECVACSFCSPGGSVDDAVVIDYAARYLTAFFARELLGDDEVGAAFEGAGAALDVEDGLVTIDAR